MIATQILPETLSDDLKEDSYTVVGYIVFNDQKHEIKKGETKIGRDSSECSIVIENFTVSKVHAVIESDGVDETFIYDVGSTNQTRLGKKILKPHCRYKLDNDSNITLGSIIVKFVLPPDEGSNVILDKSSKENCSAPDDYGDIFEVATQTVVPQSNSLWRVPVFETKSKNFPTFKIPNTKSKSSPELSDSLFDLQTQCRLDSQEIQRLETTRISKSEHYKSLHDYPEIFSLSTQCQIQESQIVREKVNSIQEADEFKLFLNDGQDDVLCAVISLHSPKEVDNDDVEKKIKTEIENLGQVLNAQTQVQASVTECHKERSAKMNGPLQDKDFSTASSCLQISEETSLNSRLKINDPANNNSSQLIEDVIKTQEFRTSESQEKWQPGNLSQDKVTLTDLGGISTDNSMKEQKSHNEDFILTQTFEGPLNKGSAIVIPETEDFDEDFMETQIYDVENEKRTVEQVTAKTTSRQSYDATADITEQDKEDDFITTQAFKEPMEAKKTNVNYEENVCSDDEDFIATQAFKEKVEVKRSNGNYEKNVASDDEDFIATQGFKEKAEAKRTNGNCEKNMAGVDEDFVATQVVEPSEITVTNSEDSKVEKSSRESSPDLLALGVPCTDSEDCIATQTFKPVKCHNSKTGFSGFSEKFISMFFSEFKRDDSTVIRTKIPEIIESSGDETESDLEILLEKHETVRRDVKIMENFQEIKSESFQIHKRVASSPSSDSNDIHVFKLKSENAQEIQSKQKQIPDSSDSDETDCEEIAILNPKIRLKHESAEPTEFEETQVLTLTPPNNFVGKTGDSWMRDGESPKFEIKNDDRLWSPLSLEMPATQEMETSVKRRNETTLSKKYNDIPLTSSKLQAMEVGIDGFWRIEPSESKVHSPKKRPSSCNDVQVVPVKKSKIENSLLKSREKQFSKVVQTHDIAQIQPNRTRNSVKNFKTELKTEFPREVNTNIERPTSRRKINTKRGSERTKVLNCDITPYVIKGGRSSRGGQKKETTLGEDKGLKTVTKIESSTRVLRSSVRNSNSPNNLLKPPERRVSTRSGRRVSTRSGKRSFRTNKSENFGGPCTSVAFTGFDCPSFDEIISELGGKKVNDVLKCEVVVADKVRRTVKFLCAIGLNLPITSPQWLMSCQKEKKFLDPWNFILKDEEAENKWDFELRTSLERSKRGKLLQGFNIFATKNTKPPVKELLAIVECCGGTPLFEPPEIWPKKTIIVSCLEDKKCWPAAKLRNVQVVHYEFILSGVLRQKIDFKTHKLR